ncbi:MAG: hypothetical protein M3Q36_02560 [bacterium]|nr:hypothetical protein [bacterium]
MATATPGAGQIRIHEISDAVPRNVDFAQRETFATIATSEFWDLDPELYGEHIVTPQMRHAIHADKFRPVLMSDARGPQQNAVDGVALNDDEYGMVLQSPNPRYFANRVEAKSRRRNSQMSPDRKQEQAKQDVCVALETKRDRMSGYIGATLSPREVLLEKVGEAAKYPGLTRRSNLTSRMEVGEVKDIIFPDLLKVIGIQKGWTKEQHASAEASLTFALFFDRTRNRHLGNWRDWIALARDHNAAKSGVMDIRIQAVETALSRM